MTDSIAYDQSGRPAWAEELLINLDRLPRLDPDDMVSAICVLERMPDVWSRRLAAAVGSEGGVHAIHSFVRTALDTPDLLVAEVAAWEGRRYPLRYRDRLEALVRAHGLGIIRAYRMRSYFHRLVKLFFNLGENDVTLVADLLAIVAGGDDTVRKLYRKLTSRNPELREYALYLLAEFGGEPIFDRFLPKLERMYGRESNAIVREAYEYLFDFEPGA